MIKLKKELFIVFIILIAINSKIAAQSDITTIKIDLDKKTMVPGTIPFDKTIKLEVTSTKNILNDFVDVIAIKTKKGKRYLRNPKLKRRINKYDKLVSLFSQDSIKNKGLENEIAIAKKSIDSIAKQIKIKNDSIKPLYILQLKNTGIHTYEAIISGLTPNKTYEFVFSKNLSKKELNLFLQIGIMGLEKKEDKEIASFYQNNVLGLEKNNLNVSSENRLNKSRDYVVTPSSIGFIKIATWEEFKDKDSNNYLIDAVRNANKMLVNLKDVKPLVLKEIQDLGKLIHQNRMNSLLHSYLLDFTEKETLNKVLNGTKVLGDNNSLKKKDSNNIIKKKVNIDKSVKLLDSLAQQIKQLKSISDSEFVATFLENSFKPICNRLKSNKEALDSLYKNAFKKLTPDFTFAQLISARTSGTEVKTKNGQQIVPDFGLINIIAFQNDGTTKYIPRPYVGVNFHFGGGIDKNIKLSDVPEATRNRFWLRTSISLGVTVGSINEGGFSDFYNGFSPAVGLNYRISDQIRLGAGLILLREEDRNPLIDTKNIEPATFINLTLDFGIFSELGKVASKLVGI